MASNTSSAVKNRWNKAHYKQISVQLDKELVQRFENKLKAENIAKAEFMRNAVKEYLGEV